MPAPSTIWGVEHPLASGDALGWRIGPMALRVRRTGTVVRFAWTEVGDPLEPALGPMTAQPEDPEFEMDGIRNGSRRLLAEGEPSSLRLEPRLPDRDVIFRAADPVRIAPRANGVVYMSTPLWVRCEVGGAALELPSHRPSDTWFGTPREGKLCYASHSRMHTQRTSVDRDGLMPHRAMTQVHISNVGDTALVVRRLRVPTPNLSIWQAGSGALWTDVIALAANGDTDQAAVQILGAPQGEFVGAQPMANPRNRPDPRPLSHVFNSFFSPRGSDA